MKIHKPIFEQCYIISFSISFENERKNKKISPFECDYVNILLTFPGTPSYGEDLRIALVVKFRTACRLICPNILIINLFYENCEISSSMSRRIL